MHAVGAGAEPAEELRHAQGPRRIQEIRKRVLLIMGVEQYIKLSSVWTAGPMQFRDMLAGLEAFETVQVQQAAPAAVIAARIDATLEHDRLDQLARITVPTSAVIQ